MRGAVRLLSVVWLAASMGMCQTVSTTTPVGPPNCLVADGSRAATLTPAKRPTAEQIQATAEAAAADPTVLVAAEPIGNFGVERYRLADYAECVGGGGCYWADLDAQTRRAEAVLDRAIALKKAGEKLAVVLDIDETSMSGFCEIRREDYGFLIEADEPVADDAGGRGSDSGDGASVQQGTLGGIGGVFHHGAVG